MNERSLDLELRLYATPFADLGAERQPRLMIFLRGSTRDATAALVPERAAAYRPGVLGVCSDDPAASEPAATATIEWSTATREEVDEVITRLEALGDLATTDLDGVLDTGDFFLTTVLQGSSSGKRFYLSLSHMQSGYRGQSAPAFAALLGRLLTMAKLTASPYFGLLARARL